MAEIFDFIECKKLRRKGGGPKAALPQSTVGIAIAKATFAQWNNSAVFQYIFMLNLEVRIENVLNGHEMSATSEIRTLMFKSVETERLFDQVNGLSDADLGSNPRYYQAILGELRCRSLETEEGK